MLYFRDCNLIEISADNLKFFVEKKNDRLSSFEAWALKQVWDKITYNAPRVWSDSRLYCATESNFYMWLTDNGILMVTEFEGDNETTYRVEDIE